MAFRYCQGIRIHLTPQTPWAYCEIDGDRGITIRNEGNNYLSVLPVVACRGTTASRPQVGESLNPVAKYKLCKVDIFRGWHLPTPTTVDNRLVY